MIGKDDLLDSREARARGAYLRDHIEAGPTILEHGRESTHLTLHARETGK